MWGEGGCGKAGLEGLPVGDLRDGRDRAGTKKGRDRKELASKIRSSATMRTGTPIPMLRWPTAEARILGTGFFSYGLRQGGAKE